MVLLSVLLVQQVALGLNARHRDLLTAQEAGTWHMLEASETICATHSMLKCILCVQAARFAKPGYGLLQAEQQRGGCLGKSGGADMPGPGGLCGWSYT